MQTQHFLSLQPQQCQDLMRSWGQPAFRTAQVADWIFKKKVRSPDEMLNLPKDLRLKLATDIDWKMPEIISKLDSQDGTTKLLLKNSRNQLIETVIMRYEGRTSLCVSSQVGCKLACTFCQTGKMGFVAHLKDYDILSQFVIANEIVTPEERRISHVVFMGMGEPFDNYENVISAANRLMAEDGYNLSHKRVTLSTSGMAPKIHSLAKDCPAALAISLHAARDDLRTELMPINRKYDLADLKEAMLAYQKETGKKITIEYILIRDKNCGIREAKDLVKFIHGLNVKVNLIPFNAHPGMPFDRPTDEEIRTFQKYLADRSIPAPVRYSKGLDVSGACGQLAAKVQETLDEKPQRKNLLLH